MLSLLFAGFLIGLKHAVEADHVAAVAAIASRGGNLRQTMRVGAAWGLGHSTTLLLVGGGVLLTSSAIPAELAELLELIVGLLLIYLGGSVLWQMRGRHIHFHAHRHGDTRHFHAHAHAPGETHDVAAHHHSHPGTLPRRAFVVGTVHGMAGSAALIVLASSALQDSWTGLLYILLFGLGSVLGMALLSAVIALPFRLTAGRLTRLYSGITGALGSATILLGALIVSEKLATLHPAFG